MDKFVEIVTTGDSEEELRKIGYELVESGIAACVQISGPLKSIYTWEGKVEETNEWECRIKSSAALADKVGMKIQELHSYEVPQIIVLPVLGGSEEYMKWVEESLS